MKKFYLTLFFIAFALLYCSKDGSNNENDETKDKKPKGEFIVFKDAVAKAQLVNLFDLNKDAELSYSEAAVVTSIKFGSTKDKGISMSNVKYLDEFQYFTGITFFSMVPNATNYISLVSFSIPKNVTQIYIGHGSTYRISYKNDWVLFSNDANKTLFKNLKTITCYSTTPPDGAVFLLLGPECDNIVYVPKQSIEQYKASMQSTIEIMNKDVDKNPWAGARKIDTQLMEKMFSRIKGF